jgi:hypothetical protein
MRAARYSMLFAEATARVVMVTKFFIILVVWGGGRGERKKVLELEVTVKGGEICVMTLKFARRQTQRVYSPSY